MIIVRSVNSGAQYYAGDGLFSTFKNFLTKTVVGKALTKGAGTALSIVPGGSLVASGVKSVAKGALKALTKTPARKIATGAAVAGTGIAIGTGAFRGGPAQPALPQYQTGPLPYSPTATGGKMTDVYARGQALPDVLDPSALRQYFRAPKGYVVVRDPASGSIMAVRKDVARRAGLWKPSAKPPISATDWKHYRSACKVEKVIRKIASREIRKARASSRSHLEIYKPVRGIKAQRKVA